MNTHRQNARDQAEFAPVNERLMRIPEAATLYWPKYALHTHSDALMMPAHPEVSSPNLPIIGSIRFLTGVSMLARNLCATVTLLFVMLVAPAIAQQATTSPQSPTPPPTQNTVENDPASWTRILEISEQAVSRDGVTNLELDRIFGEAGRIGEAALARADELAPQVAQLEQQLAELGDPSQTGQESEAIKDRRKGLEERIGVVNAQLREARLNEVTARQLQSRITKIRNDRFVGSLSARTEGLASAEFWYRFAGGMRNYANSVRIVARDSFSVFYRNLVSSFSTPILLFLGIGSLLYAFLRSRRFLQETNQRLAVREPLTQGATAASALLVLLSRGVIPALFIYLGYRVFSALDLLAPRLDLVLSGITIIVGFTLLAKSLLSQLFGYHETGRGLLAVSRLAQTRIYQTGFLLLVLAAVLAIIGWSASALIAPLEVNIGISVLYATTVGVLLLLILYRYRQENLAHGNQQAKSRVGTWFARMFIGILWGAAAAILISVMAGYVAFSEFLAQQVLLGTIIIMSGWLILQTIDFTFLQLPTTQMSETLVDADEMQTQQLTGQALIVGAGLSKLLVYLSGGMLMLLPWGYRSSDFFQIFRDIFFGFEVGGLKLSVATVLLAIGLFFVGYLVTVALRSWLRDKFLPTTNLDIGISNSISTMFGYAGFIIAAILAVTAAGFELSNLAIVAGALSVGVGFGLQSIVNNFVSGLILLAERPIKAGDWVATSGGEGYVKKISVRSTEIETFDRATVIVPNSNLITDTVKNWTHGGTTGRIIIAVGVGYGSDPEEISEILLNCAKAHPKVLGKPAPAVFFMDFGASSLDFQLRCFLGDINYALSVSSELRFAIFKALGDAGVEIPFPQRDINLRINSEQETLFKTLPVSKESE